jgi:hypothetical protein
VGDLTEYEDGRFDLVICCDAPISCTYPDHVRTIEELTRVAAQSLSSASLVASVTWHPHSIRCRSCSISRIRRRRRLTCSRTCS